MAPQHVALSEILWRSFENDPLPTKAQNEAELYKFLTGFIVFFCATLWLIFVLGRALDCSTSPTQQVRAKERCVFHSTGARATALRLPLHRCARRRVVCGTATRRSVRNPMEKLRE